MTSEQEVRSRLRRLPRPEMPADVRAQLQARLASDVGVSSQPSRGSVSDTSPPVVRAGAVFQPTAIADELKARWYEAGTTEPTRTFADSPAGISDCARAVQAYGRIIAVEVGRYADADAVVLVTSYVPNTDYEEVWIVGPGCRQGQAPVIRHMILDLDGAGTG